MSLPPALSPDRGFHAVCGRKINISIRILQFFFSARQFISLLRETDRA